MIVYGIAMCVIGIIGITYTLITKDKDIIDND